MDGWFTGPQTGKFSHDFVGRKTEVREEARDTLQMGPADLRFTQDIHSDMQTAAWRDQRDGESATVSR